MNPRTPESLQGRLDALLGGVGEWLLGGYTVAMVLVTFVVPERPERKGEAPVDVVVVEVLPG
jgi:hypothetical protein